MGLCPRNSSPCPLWGFQTLLASDALNVRDELTAFHAMVQWVQHHHEDPDDRRYAMERIVLHSIVVLHYSTLLVYSPVL